jgi:nucleotide-binding universal stress UspA family protein
MNEIVCATRGGEGSRAVQLAAIKIAKETGHPLTFLFVTSSDSLGEIDKVLRQPVREELTWMGQTLLRIAQKRAESAKIKAKICIREGQIQEEIGRYLHDSDASLLLLGAPRGITANVFGDDAVERFAQSIHDSSGVKVEIVRPESLLSA